MQMNGKGRRKRGECSWFDWNSVGVVKAILHRRQVVDGPDEYGEEVVHATGFFLFFKGDLFSLIYSWDSRNWHLGRLLERAMRRYIFVSRPLHPLSRTEGNLARFDTVAAASIKHIAISLADIDLNLSQSNR